MKIYLSMSSADLDEVRRVMDLIRDCGHEIAYDWTQSFDPSIPRSQWSELGQRDIDAACGSDLMVLWGDPTAGCYVELGSALGDRINVLWMMPSQTKNPHFFLYNELVDWCPMSLAECRLRSFA